MKTKKLLPLLLADELENEGKPSPRTLATRRIATKLSEKMGSPIDLVYVDSFLQYSGQKKPYPPLVKKYLADKEALLKSAARTFTVKTSANFLNGDIVKTLVALCSKKNTYELAILGTHGRTGLKRLFLGSVAEEVIRHSRIPVMTIGPAAQANEARILSHSPIQILVATSLTPNSARAEAFALHLAHQLKASITFTHSLREALHPVLQTAFTVNDPPYELKEIFKKLRDQSIKQLEQRVRQAKKLGVEGTYHLDERTLSASDSVLQSAKDSAASFVVMGTHGRSLAGSAFFGRTARDVILGSSAPVITVHSKQS